MKVGLRGIIRTQGRGNAPLGPATGRAGPGVLGEQEDVELNRQLKAGHEAGSATAHNHHIPDLVKDGAIRVVHRPASLARRARALPVKPAVCPSGIDHR
ncbi:MAG: hypothetical protein TH68_04160 [Candidatus Synechococcus spongiarum 142]|uniref:Uncharacterized protein n=1 Tax=Candidatus Synechococcus spongiarum 142 TaxID=1608213 RepID=A0A6N3X465_9SYNE|nr:MAG: hypothetical protein TH68_04160 [Candidatus Synechococcus spongiarum 142]